MAKKEGYDDMVQLLEKYSKPWKQMEEDFGKIELSEYKRQSSKLDQILQKKLKKKCKE